MLTFGCAPTAYYKRATLGAHDVTMPIIGHFDNFTYLAADIETGRRDVTADSSR